MDKPIPDKQEAAAPTNRTRHIPRLRTFESLKIPSYRLFISSSLFQMASMHMQLLANGWFVYKLTGSSALLGFTSLAMAIPQLTVSFIGGSVADRASKKLVLIIGLLVSSLVALGIGIFASLGVITWHYLAISSLIQGVNFAMIGPSRQSIIPEIVGRDRLLNAVALNASLSNITQIAAPAIAGFVVAGVGIQAVYYLMAGLLLVSILFLLPLRLARPQKRAVASKRGTMLGDIADGLTYVRQHQTLLTILVLIFLTFFLSRPSVTLLPVFTESILKVGPEKLGILSSLYGIGSLVGSLFIASLGNKKQGILFLHTGLLTGVAIVAFTLTTSYNVVLPIMLFSGLAGAGRVALGSTLIQTYTADAYLGRVMSLYMMETGLISLGVFATSVVAEFVGIRLAVGAPAGLLILITLYHYVFSSKIKRLD